MFAIAPTDKSWFNSLKENQFNSYVNFWTPTPWNIKNPKQGDKWYFLLKAPIRKIGGFGELVEYRNMTPDEAWRVYGARNGCQDLDSFTGKIQSYIDKHSKRFGDEKINVNSYKIGCIILKNCQFWEEEDYLDLNAFDIIVADQVVTRKIYNRYDPFVDLDGKHDRNDFNMLNDSRENYKAKVNQRRGQGKFKGVIIKAYNNRCCISGETCPELLEAAHLQNYLNENSNHVQNGILIRTDLHKLYDNNLLCIDENYVIHVSSTLKSIDYRKYNKKKILLPDSFVDYPSIEALKSNAKNFRK